MRSGEVLPAKGGGCQRVVFGFVGIAGAVPRGGAKSAEPVHPEVVGKGSRPARPRIFRPAVQRSRTVHLYLGPHRPPTTSGCTGAEDPPVSGVASGERRGLS